MQFARAFDALKRLDEAVHRSSSLSPAQIRARLKRAAEAASAHPYDPVLRHSLRYVLLGADLDGSQREEVLRRIQSIRKTLETAHTHTIEAGAFKLKSGANVATHGHSEFVERVLARAANAGKKLSVHIAGRHDIKALANSLAVSKLDVTLYRPEAARLAVRGSDIVLLGCDVVTPDAIVAPIGAELIASIAKLQGIPVYVIASGLDFDPKADDHVENLRNFNREEHHRRGGVRHNHAQYESISPELVTGVISELGIHPHARFIEESQKHYPWID